MEQLSVLEKKLALLIESKKNDIKLIKELNDHLNNLETENAKLKEQLEYLTEIQDELKVVNQKNKELNEQLEKLENNLLTRHDNLENLNQERELTKMAVEDLIKDIDTIVGNNQ